MRLGLALLTVAASALGAAVWLPGMLSDNDLAVVTEVDKGGVARVAVPAPERSGQSAADPEAPRFFGFALPGLSSERPKESQAHANGTAPMAREVVRTVDASPASVVPPQPKLATRPSTEAPALVVAPVPVHTATREVPRHELVRDLQRELKRVGCYAGDVDGNWGPGSRRAAQAFMTRLNSAMPTEEPDFIQLTLVRGFTGQACNAPCPPEQMVPGSARCQPSAAPAMVTATRPAVRPIEERNTALRPASSVVTGSTPLAPIATPQVVRSGVTPPAVPAPEVAAAPPVIVTPLEGRMTVGGPQLPPGADAASLATGVPPRAAQSGRPGQSYRQQSSQRRDRSWTGSFFNN